MPFDQAQHFLKLAQLYRADEKACLSRLIPDARLEEDLRKKAQKRAAGWVEEIRSTYKPSATVIDMLGRFGLTSHEGIALMCLAEALLRIPDKATADALIQDKFEETHWDKALAHRSSWTLTMTSWALTLTGRIIHIDDPSTPGSMLKNLVSRLGQPVIREAIKMAMQWMADQFVMGENIESALRRSESLMREGVRFSFDMLGEGARTAEDATLYFERYEKAITAIGTQQKAQKFPRPSGISIKLSALHPRYEMAQCERVLQELTPRLVALCKHAAAFDMLVTIDAEEGDRLQLSLEVASKVIEQIKGEKWQGLGFAIQAYDKRAPAVIDYLVDLAKTYNKRFHIRLVKGAYWDTEIKRGQQNGWSDFSVYTRKVNTDVSYLACVKRMLAARKFIAPVFAGHNALTIAYATECAGDLSDIEFQRLHGMGEELHTLMRRDGLKDCIYAPVGAHDVLLAYLVRRILENGANSSFVNRVLDPALSIADLTLDPVEDCIAHGSTRHSSIRLPKHLFSPERTNSVGLDLADPFVTDPLLRQIEAWHKANFSKALKQNPSLSVEDAFSKADKAFDDWSKTSVEKRASCLDKLADKLEANQVALMALLIHEGGKIIPDGISEIREAVDFCRYYAMRARLDFRVEKLPGPTGESNYFYLTGRGTFVTISPWNFPLAIYLGQIAAALVAGNTVIAKPAPQTPQIALFVGKLIHEAGIPEAVFQVMPGSAEVGAALVAHPSVAGVAFTGSTLAAHAINRSLAGKDGPIVPLIAETGGQNALIVDSSALPEQVIDDILVSSFRSAGQRCSALRVLCLPHEVADKIIVMLKGAMQELSVGDPSKLSTDVGPIIDAPAKERLLKHVMRLRTSATEIYTVPLSSECERGNFVAPQAWEIPSISFLTGEVFGPILHIVRYKTSELSALIAQINATGFGLTGGLHSRITTSVARVERELEVGNFYVNRSLIGAVVGVQPFGGHGLSGTGPKAGGPHYLLRFASERVTSINTTAAGGNATLLIEASD